MKFEHAGCYQIETVYVELFDYLNLFSVKKEVGKVYEGKIEPTSSMLGEEQFNSLAQIGEQLIIDKNQETENDIRDFRTYQPGDRMQRVHWKLSARTEEWMVKELESGLDSQIVLYIDLYYAKEKEDALDWTLSYVGEMGKILLSKGQTFQMCYLAEGGSRFMTRKVGDVEEFEMAMDALLHTKSYASKELLKQYLSERENLNRYALVIDRSGVWKMK